MIRIGKDRIESKLEVDSLIQNMKYVLNNGAVINFQMHRLIDKKRKEEFTNSYTVSTLFPDENPVNALKRELAALTAANYIRTVKNSKFPKRSEFREFGKVYDGKKEVYIKIRIELLSLYGSTVVFVMSFHFAEKVFAPEMFPYRKKGEIL